MKEKLQEIPNIKINGSDEYNSAAFITSASSVNQSKLILTAPLISFLSSPIAVSTWLGCGLWLEQAEPVETYILCASSE